MPQQIPTGKNAESYVFGRGYARYNARKPLPTDPLSGTPAWWVNEGLKDVWAGVPSRIGQETIYNDAQGNPLPVIGGPQAAPGYNRRPAPVYQPRPGQTGTSYQIPAPPAPPVATPIPTGGVTTTYEIYGSLNGRRVPIWNELTFDGISYHVKRGGRILISHNPGEGYGLGGTPGSWGQLYGSRSPADFGLDADRGVVAFDGNQPFSVSSAQLVEIFGPGWRQTVYM